MLFFKECKRTLFSLTFIIYCCVLILMFFTQYFQDAVVLKDRTLEEGGDYGYTMVFDEDTIMKKATSALLNDFYNNSFICYPYGFYKNVSLSEIKQDELKRIIMEMTGLSEEEIAELKLSSATVSYYEGLSTKTMYQYKFPDLEIADGMTYEYYCELIDRTDKILGGGSYYRSETLENYYSYEVPKTYEQALAEYNEFAEDDKITGGLARLFCDYSGIFNSLLPAFVAAALCYADKKHKAQSLIFSRRISSAKLIFSRFAAIVFMLMIPIFLTAVIAHLYAIKCYPDQQIDHFAFYKMTLVWILPGVMISAAYGMLITEIWSPFVAVISFAVIWYRSVFLGIDNLVGDISKFGFIVRHNSEMCREDFMRNIDNFIFD